MPGWRFKHDRLELTVFAGLDFQDHLLTPDDPASAVRGRKWGARGGADLWYEPWHAIMLAGNVSVSSIGPGYWSRAAAGWRVLDMIWLGPEALALGDPSYQQYRVGAHMNGLKTKWLEWRSAQDGSPTPTSATATTRGSASSCGASFSANPAYAGSASPQSSSRASSVR
jgi:hypothetical protein